MGAAAMIAAAILPLLLMGPPEIDYDKALDALAQVETGTHWVDGRIVGGYRCTSSASAFQLTRRVVHDAGADFDRCARDPAYAGGVAARWLAHLVEVSGSLRTAFAAYRSGLGERRTRAARAYAARAMNLYLSH